MFTADIEKLAWHGIKVIASFAMMEKRRLPRKDFLAFMRSLSFASDVNARYLNLPADELASRIERELLLVNALRLQDDWLIAG
jgi:hypothetical protein